MIKEAIGVGATIDEAKNAALIQLGAPDEADIKFETLEFPTKKTLGLFGGKPAKVRVSYEASPFGEAEAYIAAILKGMGLGNSKIEIGEDSEGGVAVELDCGDDYGVIIGRRGETLDAIQYLVRLVINKGNDNYKRVSVNIGNYREKRENTLTELAKKNAAKVLKYGRNVVLEPMNPYERRIIHTTVQSIEGVESHSVGSDSERKVVITLAEGVKPTHANDRYGSRDNRGGNRGGYNNNRDNRGGNRGSGDRRPAGNSQPRQPQQSQRSPRSDFSGASLYGKIEPKSQPAPTETKTEE